MTDERSPDEPIYSDAQATNKAIMEFVAMAAHDLRTPLSVVTGMVSLLKDTWDRSSDEQKLDGLDMIENASHQLFRLVDDLLLISRAEADVLKPRSEPVHIAEFLRHVGRTFPSEVELEAPQGLTANTDPDHLQRIVTNLISNAHKYGAPPIRVSVSGDQETIEICVTDAGPGVPEDLIPRLFAKFARGPHSSKADSTGLGLAIARSLARANGGDVRYEPNQPTGSSFCVRLPAVSANLTIQE